MIFNPVCGTDPRAMGWPWPDIRDDAILGPRLLALRTMYGKLLAALDAAGEEPGAHIYENVDGDLKYTGARMGYYLFPDADNWAIKLYRYDDIETDQRPFLAHYSAILEKAGIEHTIRVHPKCVEPEPNDWYIEVQGQA